MLSPPPSFDVAYDRSPPLLLSMFDDASECFFIERGFECFPSLFSYFLFDESLDFMFMFGDTYSS